MAPMIPSLEHNADQGHMIEHILQLTCLDLLVQRVKSWEMRSIWVP